MTTPILRYNSFDWVKGECKTILKTDEEDGTKFTLEYIILRADDLLEAYQAGDVDLVAEVRSPHTLFAKMYTKLDKEATFYSKEGRIVAEISLETGNLASQYYVRPLLVAVRDFDLPTKQLSPLWVKEATIPIKKGVILAEDKIWNTKDESASIFKFKIASEGEVSEDGEVRVKYVGREVDFLAYVTNSTMNLVKDKRNPLAKAIHIAALAEVLQQVAQLSPEEEAEDSTEGSLISGKLLNRLGDELAEREIDLWDSDNTFDALRVATALHPFGLNLDPDDEKD